MNFLGMGPGELMVILVLALIVFGPQKLPEIGRSMGKAIGEFRRATTDITNEINRELSLDPPPASPPKSEPPAPLDQPPAVEVPAGHPSGDPLILEIDPSTHAAGALSNGVDVAPPPVETLPESPTAHVPAEEAPAKPVRARRTRKTAVEPAASTESAVVAADSAPEALAVETVPAEPAPKPRRRRKTEAPLAEGPSSE